MASATEAREAFLQEVFGEIVKVEISVKETAVQVRSMVDEFRKSEAVISLKTSELLDAANQLAKSNEIVSLQSRKALDAVVRRIEAGTITLNDAVRPLTELSNGLYKAAKDEAEKHAYNYMLKKEKKLDSMLATMDVFLQQIELASERLPQLEFPPQKVSQINEGNINYLKNGWDIRIWRRYLKNIWVKKQKN